MSESLETKSFFPDLQRHVTPTTSGSTIVSYTSDLGPDTPILTLIHGYPQSAYIWRYVVPALKDKISLFVPELPGYGISSPIADSSKLVVGEALLEALTKAFGVTAQSPRRLVLGGHDRGARISHRLAVHKQDRVHAHFPGLRVVAAALLDILPTKIQWDRFQDPVVSQTYFHWPLLANTALAVPLLTAFGGDKWCRAALRLAGKDNAQGRARLEADGAVDVYAALFAKPETLRGSCDDYAASAAPEYAEQAADQDAGRKIDVPVIVLFSQANIGARTDVAAAWKSWIAPGTPYVPVPIGQGYGHYLPEEAHDLVVDHLRAFLDEHL